MREKINIWYFNKNILLVGLFLIILSVIVGFYFNGITGNAIIANYSSTAYAPPYNLENPEDFIFTISSDSLVAVDDLANLTASVFVDEGYIYQKGYVFNQLTHSWEVFNFEQTPVENSYWIRETASKDLVINVSNRVVNNSETYIVAYACQKDSNEKWQCGCQSEGETNCKKWMLHKFDITNITVSPEINCTDNANCSMTNGICIAGKCVSRRVFSGLGSGTFEDPYQITTWAQLNEVRYDLSSNYILMNDLDENSEEYSTYASSSANDGNGWKPLGGCGPNYECESWDYNYAFRGTLNGNGYSINNLTINNIDGRYLGLFGYIEGTNISNLNMGGELNGNIYIGGIVGYMVDSSIINSSSSAIIYGVARSVGGLVGEMVDSSIINSSSSAIISGEAFYVGGLVGEMINSSIINSLSSAIISGGYSGLYYGGIAGYMQSSSSIINSSSSATLIGGTNSGSFGGISGVNWESLIINSSVWISDSQTLSSASNIGLIVGQLFGGIITNTFGTIYDPQFGNITFLDWKVNRTSGGNLTNLFYLNSNYVNIGISTSSANISLFGTPLSGSNIYRKTGLCGGYCYNFTPLNAGTVRFNITGVAGNYYIV